MPRASNGRVHPLPQLHLVLHLVCFAEVRHTAPVTAPIVSKSDVRLEPVPKAWEQLDRALFAVPARSAKRTPSETVGNPDAIEHLPGRLIGAFGTSNVQVSRDRSCIRTFKFANGQISDSYGTITIAAVFGSMTVHMIESQGVPLLLGINSLRSFDAMVVFRSDQAVFTLGD